jgi:LemA protein
MSISFLTFLLISTGLVILAAIPFAMYNSIIYRMNAVKRAWADVIVQERQKGKILPALEAVVDKYKAYEESIQLKVTELRSALSRLNSENIDVDGLSTSRATTSKIIGGLQMIAENYPDLKAAESFNRLMAEISEQEENVGAAIRIFNQNVEEFNNYIEAFPSSLVNSHFNKKEKVATFTDSEASAAIEYTPNI